ncbi:MAG: XdhC family protein [Clostridia bacterium]|nr:XdhC family protein [Clostridia bacterium]
MKYYDILQAQLKAHRDNLSYAIVTIADTDGGTTRTEGKMLVFENGDTLGTVGGGAVELLAIRDAKAALTTGMGGLRSYDLNNESAAAGSHCGGAMQVLIEVIGKRPTLVMCGAGHVGMALMPLARTVGFQVILVDSRPENLIADAIAMADRFVPVQDHEKDIAALDIGPGAYYVIAGPNHDIDGAQLAGALVKDGAYVGMMGGPPKINSIFAKLRAKGFSQEILETVYTPIGLNISNERPEEIAISILSEMLMVKNGKDRPAGV